MVHGDSTYFRPLRALWLLAYVVCDGIRLLGWKESLKALMSDNTDQV